MKKSTAIIMILVALSTFHWIKLQAQVRVIGHVTAEVIESLNATETAQLNFGRFAPQFSGGQLIMTPQGALMSTGNIILSSSTHNAASFFITGESGVLFSITLPNGPVTMINTQNSKTMSIINWTSDPKPGMGIILPEGGSQVVLVGATLVAGSMYDNPVGIYTGTYAITFSYN
jgi:hypothetical protein